jgi:hypothetical protein
MVGLPPDRPANPDLTFLGPSNLWEELDLIMVFSRELISRLERQPVQVVTVLYFILFTSSLPVVAHNSRAFQPGG